jgi:hypothetical protein
MYFKVSMRNNPAAQTSCGYYRLVESYRNETGRVCHRTLLNVGFLEEVVKQHLPAIQTILTDKASGKQDLFPCDDPTVQAHVAKWWKELIDLKRVDVLDSNTAKKLVKIDSIKHKDVREVGAEWLAYQALEQLQIDRFLEKKGWSQESRQLALTQIASRAVYPASENKTSKWLKENSAQCEITGYPVAKMTKDKLYKGALDLYKVKDDLEAHLSKKTNELFDLQDKIVLYDLTNTYFEGRKDKSKLAQYGRSKEKRSDAKLAVLALVVNPEGFVKYSNTFEGNMADSKSLEKIIDNLRRQTSYSAERALIVIDAGIATEENLKLIVEKGYDYLCVARSKPKDYKVIEGQTADISVSNNGYKLSLQRVESSTHQDYYLRVNSPAKRIKEQCMKTAFESRFEEELTKIEASLHKKQGTKLQDKVHERIGRAKQKYPSIAGSYTIDIGLDIEGKNATSLNWSKDQKKETRKQQALGEYFLRSNIEIDSIQKVWDYYNTIREIEAAFRCLKTELDLRPVYHKTDEATMAHLHLALLAYWIVNTVRYQLKANGIRHSWTEIVRIANSQKMITTSGLNIKDETVSIRKCSEPDAKLAELYSKLNYKSRPFAKRKSVVHKTKLEKSDTPILQESPPT